MTSNPPTSRRKPRRARGPIPDYRPRPATVEMLEAIRGVLAELDADDLLPTTARSVFYRLLGRGWPKSKGMGERVSDAISNARRAGLIEWSAIADRNLLRHRVNTWTGVDEFAATMRRTAAGLRVDLQVGQPVRVLVWCEAAGMVPLLSSVADDYTADVLTTSGYDSTTVRHEIGRWTGELGSQQLHVLHVGDHDHDGRQIFTAMSEDLAAWAGHYGGQVTVERLAVTPDQIEAMSLPDDPDKPGSVQAEAIPPGAMRNLLRDRLDELLDADLLDRRRADQDRLREQASRLLRPSAEG
jgi:hypothetical protein